MPTAAAPDSVEPLRPETPRVLVVSIDHHLGNTVIQLPVIAALARYFVRGVDLVVDARYASLIESLDPPARPRRVLRYPAQRDANFCKRKPPVAIARVGARVMAARYRAVVDLSGGKWSAGITRVSLARRRVGFADVRWPGCYTHRVTRPAESPQGPHALDRYAAMLAVTGAEPGARPPAVRLSARGAHAGLDPAHRWVVMHPFAGKAGRRWPAARFAAVARALIDGHGVRVVVVGAAGDQPAGSDLVALIRRPGQALFLSPALPQLMAVFEQAQLLVSNESGPTHLAATTRIPIVTLFGPTSEAAWRPLREQGLTILRGRTCPPACAAGSACPVNGACLTDLSVETVFAAAAAALEAGPPPQAAE